MFGSGDGGATTRHLGANTRYTSNLVNSTISKTYIRYPAYVVYPNVGLLHERDRPRCDYDMRKDLSSVIEFKFLYILMSSHTTLHLHTGIIYHATNDVVILCQQSSCSQSLTQSTEQEC